MIPQQLAYSVAGKMRLEIYQPPMSVDPENIFMTLAQTFFQQPGTQMDARFDRALAAPVEPRRSTPDNQLIPIFGPNDRCPEKKLFLAVCAVYSGWQCLAAMAKITTVYSAPKTARKELRAYRRKGPRGATARLLQVVQASTPPNPSIST